MNGRWHINTIIYMCMMLCLIITEVSGSTYETEFYGSTGGFANIELFDQGRITGITGWGASSTYQGIVIESWTSDNKSNNQKIGTESVTSAFRCISFQLTNDEFIKGYRVTWGNIGTNRWVRMLVFVINTGDTHACSIDPNVYATLTDLNDSGVISLSGQYLTGFKFRYGGIIDAIGFQFSTLITTATPTILPTSIPTSIPSKTPTKSPTKYPSRNPTSNPSRNPTEYPTFLPTFIPTHTPTSIPTYTPTLLPITSTPTNIPTLFPTKAPSTIANPTISDDRHVLESTIRYTVTDVTYTKNNFKSNAKSISMVYIIIAISAVLIAIFIIVCVILCVNVVKKPKKHQMDKIEVIEPHSSSAMMVTMETNQKTESIFSENLTNLNAVNNVLMDDVVNTVDTNTDHEAYGVITTTKGFNDNLNQIIDTESDIDDDDIINDIADTMMSGEHHDPEVIDFDEEQTNNQTQLYENKSSSNKSVKFAQDCDVNNRSGKRKKKQSVQELLEFNETPKGKPVESQYEHPNELELDDAASEQMFEPMQHRKKSTIGTVSEFNTGENTEGDV